MLVGDIVQCQGGYGIAVDGLLLQNTAQCQVDESAMTGESDHLTRETLAKCYAKKDEHEAETKNEYGVHDVPTPLLLSGTHLTVADGWMVVLVVGKETCEGQIMAALEGKSSGMKLTPLQVKLNTIAEDIGKLGMFCAILIFHALMARNFIEGMVRYDFDLFGGEQSVAKGGRCKELTSYTINGQRWKEEELFPAHKAILKKDPKAFSASTITLTDEAEIREACPGKFLWFFNAWLTNIITGVAIVVVAVPEGLPLAVMLSLAYSVQKMLEDQNFVKKLMSCEIMGGANNICSDKTGTLTKNEMTWVKIWQGTAKDIVHPDKQTGAVASKAEEIVPNEKVRTLLYEAVACNTTGTTAAAGATDKAMLKLMDMWGVEFQAWRDELLPADFIRFAFDSARKRTSTIIKTVGRAVPSEVGHDERLHIKGASELVLATCTHFLDSQGNKQPLDDSVKAQIMTQIQDFAREALRTIAFAYKDLKENEGGADHSNIQPDSKVHDVELSDNVLICIAGIRDVIRGEVPGAVKRCKTAGVRVRMVTGDNKITAIAIAKECRIIEDDNDAKEQLCCMEGPEFEAYVGGLVSKRTGEKIAVLGEDPDDERIGDIEAMKRVRANLKVLARSRPNDKYIMVAGLRELGDVVAVTGDGTNDAPALKKADVGFAMATGTQVAHSASDIIIQDDNFASIVKACMWGRNVFDNIRRFLQFQLTVNVCALVVAFFGSVILTEPPLSAIQFLWVNMIMDTLAALALATGLPTLELLDRPPYRRNEYIVNQKMAKHIIGQTALQLGILFAFVFAAPQFVPEGLPEKCKGLEFARDCDDDEWWTNVVNLDRAVLADHPTQRWRDWDGKLVIDGTPTDLSGAVGYALFKDDGYSRHMTTVFNIFVWFQIFNMICSRKIDDKWNVFDGIFTNPLFVIIWVVICLGQFLMCQYAGRVFKVHKYGLTGVQWAYTTLPALSVFVFNALLKCVPDSICPQLGTETDDEKEVAAQEYKAIYVKPSVAKHSSARMRGQANTAKQFM